MMRVGAAVGVAAAATPLLLGATVQADNSEPKPVRKCKISELPIYGEPPKREFEYVPFEETVVMKPPYDAVTVCRQQVAGVVQSVQGTANKALGKLENKVPRVTDFVRYVQEESTYVAKAAVISTAGLTGMLLGYRGGVSRRVLWAGVGMATATTVCYPKQTVDIMRNAWNSVEGPHHYAPPNQPMDIPAVGEEISDKIVEKLDPNKVDHGMSKEEDKDMYTTRE